MTASEIDLAALLHDARVELAAVLDALVKPLAEVHAITPPARGIAVLMCRCGAVMDMEGMYRYEPPRPSGSGSVVLRPICCWDCSTEYSSWMDVAV